MTQGLNAATEDAIRIRYRIRFGKVDLLKWISHRDLAQLWERIVRRAFLKPSMTEGFHPKPRISFASALALGVESNDEVMEIDLAEEISPIDLMHRLIADEQPGLIIRSVARLPEALGKAKLQRLEYEITLPTDQPVDSPPAEQNDEQNDEQPGANASQTTNPASPETQPTNISRRALAPGSTEPSGANASQPTTTDADPILACDLDSLIHDGIARVNATDNVTLKRKKKEVTLNLKEQVHSLSFDGELIRLSLSHSDGATLRPEDVLDLMGLASLRERGGRIRRTAVVLANEFLSDDPDLMVTSDSSIAASESSPEQPLGVH